MTKFGVLIVDGATAHRLCVELKLDPGYSGSLDMLEALIRVYEKLKPESKLIYDTDTKIAKVEV